MGIGILVKNMRIERGYGLRQFAQKAGVNFNTLKSIEDYDSWPKLDNAIKIARALGLTIDELIAGVPSESIQAPVSDEELRGYLLRYPGMDMEKAECALACIRAIAKLNTP
jgi:DNA-binding XRE family transcriptional regulator